MTAAGCSTRWKGLLLVGLLLTRSGTLSSRELVTPPASGLGTLHYLTEEYKPYNYQELQGQPTGFSVELLRRIWQRLGIAEQPIRLLPWARGYSQLLHSPDVVLFSTAQTRSRLPLFQWACPIAQVPIVLIALKESHIRLQNTQQLDYYRIGAVRADVGEQLLHSQGVDPVAIHNSNSLLQALKQLSLHRIDLVSSSGPVAWQLLQDMGADTRLYEEVWTLDSQQLCYAFSRQIDPEWVRQFQLALNEVRQQKEFASLLHQFGLQP
jgi:polar amino acid transport system substrate-binding protein